MARAAIGMCFDRTFPASTVVEFARRLEDAGAAELWLIEDCFYTTAPPLAAAALAVTERLTVGLGILPAVARTAAVTAMEITTLAGLGPGRVIAGIGHGVQSWMAQMGAATPSPVTTLEEVLTAVRRLLAGEEVTFSGRHLDLDAVRLQHPPSPVPPVLAGVRGPRSMAVAGRSADGVLLDAPCTADYVRWAKGAAGGGSDLRISCFTTMCVSPDPRLAHRIMAPWLADVLDDPHHVGLTLLPFHEDLEELNRKRGVEGLAGMPRDWWVAIGAIGTMDDAFEHLAGLEEAGVHGVSVFPAPDLQVARAQVDDVRQLVRR